MEYSSNSNRYGSKPSFGGRSSFSSRPSFGGRPSFSGRPSFGGGRRNFGRKKGSGIINENMYIKHIDTLKEKTIFEPKNSFSDLNVNSILKTNIISKGFTKMTPIQDQVIPLIIEKHDVVGIANTGTGKTAAFLIPLIQKVLDNRITKVLIIVPTRELAVQITDEFFLLAKNTGLYAVECIGGSSIFRQISNIKQGYNFIIGTPGRLNDLVERRILDFKRFNTVVLDEVDRMLDMGFVDEIKKIIAYLPTEKQSLFFSATLDPKVETIMKMLLRPDYMKISVKTGDTAENVHQDIIKVKDRAEKNVKLVELLQTEEVTKSLIFVNTKRGVDTLQKSLRDMQMKVECIHGDKRQRERQRALDNFKYGQSNILIATDVAARGIDVIDISHVINYDVPEDFQDYIHRIGRTGRADKIGVALTFIQSTVTTFRSSFSSRPRYHR